MMALAHCHQGPSIKPTDLKVSGLWGDGLVDRSLSTHWYPSRWEDVDLDELTFFMPGLAARSKDGTGGVAVYIRQALARRIRYASQALTNILGKARLGAGGIIEIVEDCAGVEPGNLSRARLATPGSAYAAVDDGYEIADRLEAERYAVWQRLMPTYIRTGSAAVLVHELSVIACLDRMLRDCLTAGDAPVPGSNSETACFQADALVASVYSRINAAYVYPQLMLAHETFSAGAWLGVLEGGRSALLPEAIAGTFEDLYQRNAENGPAPDACDAVLLYHSDITAGRSRLRRQARHVTRHGRAAFVRSRRLRFSQRPAPPVWNSDLCAAITQRLLQHRLAV